MKITGKRSKERGIALLLTILFLVLLSAMGLGIMYMATTETQVNSNFRAEQSAYFAARAGIEELRDRLRPASSNPITLPTATVASGLSANSVKYLINEGGSSGSVTPWTATSTTADTELCHESANGLTVGTVGVPCSGSNIPSGTPTTITSVLPFADTSAAIPFKWVRITLKQGNSVQNYPVSSGAGSTQVCWNGTNEVLLTAANCSAMSPSAKEVYVLTALAITNSGGRKMVQSEVALQPTGGISYGMYATATGCGAVTLTGNSSTDSYTSANGGTYASTKTNTGGDVGANGNVTANGNVSIGGSVVSVNYSGTGTCATGHALSTTGNAGLVSNSANQVKQISAPTIPTPVIPTTNGPDKTSGPIPPGDYGNIRLSGNTTLTLTSGVYNINSISVSGNATIKVSGAVTINVQGANMSGNAVIDLGGNAVDNGTGPASNMVFNYAGTGDINLHGNDKSYMIVDAPNAKAHFVGNTSMYGALIANTIDNNGNVTFHYDKNVTFPANSASYFSQLSFHELFY